MPEDPKPKSIDSVTDISIIAIVISVISVMISALSAGFTYQQYQLSMDVAHLHITPKVSMLFDMPKNGNPIIVIHNDGDISVVSLSVRHKMFVYDKGLTIITNTIDTNMALSDIMTFKEKFNPMEYIKEELVKLEPIRGFIAIYKLI